MVVPYHQRPRFYLYEHYIMFQMVAGAPATKSAFQTIGKEERTKNCTLLFSISRKFPQYVLLHLTGQKLDI